MVVSTRWLFIRLLRTLRIGGVCDIGSMNGADALAFREVLPMADIVAFEANPENFRQMQLDPQLRAKNIGLAPCAVTNYDGESPFFLVKTDYSLRHDRRGMSSLHRRADESLLDAVVAVKTTTLDTFLRESQPRRKWALWIDVEGKAFEAVEGASRTLDSVALIHVEVESVPCIGADQKLFEHVEALLLSAGFCLLATDRSTLAEQFNALFVRRNRFAMVPLEVRLWTIVAWLRRRLAIVVRRVLHGRKSRQAYARQ